MTAALGMTAIAPAAVAQPSAGSSDPAGAQAITGVPAAVPNSPVEKISAWQDLQFGLFMHWGAYSMFEGSFKGKKQSIGYPEQIKAWMKISDEDYLAEAAKMTADK